MIKANHLFLFLTAFLFLACAEGNSRQVSTPVPTPEELQADGLEVATFAGGCFWCTEAVFERVKGVSRVVSGYTGGPEKNPTYEQVSYGRTGHAEGVQIFYDPQQITYPELLEIFFATHDPTTLNRQGPDVGKQYRSAIFYHNQQQKERIEAYIRQLKQNKTFRDPVVTEIKLFKVFYNAEDYHQDYYLNNPNDRYVLGVARPKVVKFEKEFKEKLKPADQ
ncbi:peptide-methionine (S)-S-oxide reductase MsrA [soil metagenome]